MPKKMLLWLFSAVMAFSLFLGMPVAADAEGEPTVVEVSGDIAPGTTWTADNVYVVKGDLLVPAGVTLTIEPGVIVKVKSGVRILVSGTLDAQGTADEKIYITDYRDDTVGGDTNGDEDASAPAPGGWTYLLIGYDADGNATLDHCVLRYGGGSWGGHGNRSIVIVNAGGNVSITNSQISDSALYGVWTEGTTGTIILADNLIQNNVNHGIWSRNSSPSLTGNTLTGNGQYGLYVDGDSLPGEVSGNTFSANTSGSIGLGYRASGTSIADDNTGVDALWLTDGTINIDTTWGAPFPYVLNGDFYIQQSVTLTIEPGVIVKVKSGVRILVNGTLDAQGTADEKIYITDYRDDTVGGDTNGDGDATVPAPGGWTYLLIGYEADGNATLDHCVLRYGGGSWGGWGNDTIVAVNAGGNVSITNSQISDSALRGVRIDGATGTITLAGNLIQNNANYGIYINNSLALIGISGCSIVNNASGQIYSNTSPNVTISNTPVEELEASIAPGEAEGTTAVTAAAGAGNKLVVKVLDSEISTPDVLSIAPAGDGVSDPYTSGSDIAGVDAVTNKYVGVYQVNSTTGQVMKFKAFTLASTDIKPVSISIDDLSISITAPAKWAVGQDATTGTPGATHVSTTWKQDGNDHSGPFSPATIYTADVVLSANEGYKFSSDVNVTSSAGTAGTVTVSGSGTGNSISFTVTFEATEPLASAAINPAAANYDLFVPGDVTATITWNDASDITGITSLVNGLDEGSPDADDYTVVDTTLTIKKEYLQSLVLMEGDVVEITISFDVGDDATLTVSVIDTTPAAPVFQSAATSADGTNVILTFDKAMADPAGKHEEFSFKIGENIRSFSAAALDGVDPTRINLTVDGAAVSFGDEVKTSYTAGTVLAADGGVLASFTDETVTNNVPPTDAQKAAADKDALIWDSIRNSNTDIDAVTANLNLISSGATYGSTISWQSDNTSVITNDGTVTRPASASGNARVNMIATLTCGSASNTKVFTLIVLAQTPAPSGGGGGGGGGGGSTTTVALEGWTSSTELKLGSSGLRANAVLSSTDGKITLEVKKGTKMMRDARAIVSKLTLELLSDPPVAPPDHAVVLAYDFGPDGATFNPPLTITMPLPEGADPEKAAIAWWDGAAWVNLPTTYDLITGMLTAQISHFTTFAVIFPDKDSTPALTPTPTPTVTLTPTMTPTITPTITPAVTPTAPVTSSAPVTLTPIPTPGPEPTPPNYAGLIAGIAAGIIVVALGIVFVLKRKKTV